MYNKKHILKKKNILLGIFLKKGSFDYIHCMRTNDAKGNVHVPLLSLNYHI